MSVKRLNKFHLRGYINPATKRRRVFILFLQFSQLNQVCTTVSGFRDRLSIPSSSTMQQSLRGRMDPDRKSRHIALFLRGTNRHRQQCFHRIVRSSNSSDTTPESRSRPSASWSCRLSQLRSRRNIPGTALPEGVGRNFTHHDDFQPVLTTFSP